MNYSALKGTRFNTILRISHNKILAKLPNRVIMTSTNNFTTSTTIETAVNGGGVTPTSGNETSISRSGSGTTSSPDKFIRYRRNLTCSCSSSTPELKKMSKYRIVMVRHGESEWNQLNLFCGWFDAGLSDKGKNEATAAGKALKNAGYTFDVAHTSMLTRAQNTLQSILKEINQENIPIEKTWRLNERHYGGLTGMNKAETAAKYGEEQVQIWRRSFDTPPPPMENDHKYYETIVKDPRYAAEPKPEEFPRFESLKLTIDRTLPYWNNTIIPQLKEGKKIIIAAHGNSLRGIVKHLDGLSNDEIMGLNLPTGIPFVYELDENFKPVVSMKFLGDEETVKAAIAAVAAQGKAK